LALILLILLNFHVTAIGGSLFLFDRKVLRYFRKDGHNWRKKKDGKTVKEAHEKLKAGSIDVLHCYYAHGEENENFQRRTYWLLEEDFTHIVLVHYLEVKGCKQSFSRVKEEFMQLSNVESPSCSNSITSQNQMGPQTMEAAESPISRQISDYEDTESVYLKRNSVQQIISEQAPDTTLSLRCSSLWMDS